MKFSPLFPILTDTYVSLLRKFSVYSRSPGPQPENHRERINESQAQTLGGQFQEQLQDPEHTVRTESV